MGIPRLHQLLLPYGTPFIATFSQENPPSTTSPRPVVIDGPSFAYHIHHALVSLHRPRSLTALPRYPNLARAAPLWLAQLERFNLRVVAIAFDGALPSWKIETRVGRLETKVGTLIAWKAGLNAEEEGEGGKERAEVRMLGDGEEPAFLARSFRAGERVGAETPAAPFLTAAVVEGLRASRFAGLVTVVAGEADGFCAQAAREHQDAVVLSNDGDLMVHDLGATGSVMSFRSMTVEKDTEGASFTLKGMVFSPSGMAARLGLPSLLPFGFCLRKLEWKSSFTACVEAAKDLDKEDESYRTFLEEYDCKPPSETDPSITAALQGCDSMVSEYLWLQLTGPTGKQCVPTTYLPVLIEDPSRSTAWDQSISIRQIAYTLVSRTMSKRSSPHTIELTRRAFRIAPVGVPHLPQTDLADRIGKLVEVFTNVSSGVPGLPTILLWRAIALSLLLPLLSDTANVIFRTEARDILMGNFILHRGGRRAEWPFIHLSAQLQAIWYSLRILTQVIRFIRSVSSSLLKLDISRLDSELESLPDVSGFFDDATVEGKPVEEVLGWLEGRFGEVVFREEMKKGKRRKKVKGGRGSTGAGGVQGTGNGKPRAAAGRGNGYFSVLTALEEN